MKVGKRKRVTRGEFITLHLMGYRAAMELLRRGGLRAVPIDSILAHLDDLDRRVTDYENGDES